MPPFNVLSRRSSPENSSFNDFFQNSATKMANCSIVDIVHSLMLLPANSLQLMFNFLFPFIKI